MATLLGTTFNRFYPLPISIDTKWLATLHALAHQHKYKLDPRTGALQLDDEDDDDVVDGDGGGGSLGDGALGSLCLALTIGPIKKEKHRHRRSANCLRHCVQLT